ncbi:mitochondrial import inner membrane translocase subunit Tim23 [Drosophila guanche]|uniref:Blast:Mitochondrial import inner membrane translocase subunit Tim23 n=1 Tax=Drosophila guanche TaxID=7266 RepID=A0A3B0KK82_DROGU|nr:mitochondrial import inner membrane translocase subunit Tim23 [Drosophila guanche]SPP85551.1 blast:Mitochondrial import inner membrane translocase subunit Tim23 [Drosophila guanche]
MSDDFLRKPFSLAPAPAADEATTSNYASGASKFSSGPVSPYLNYDSRYLQRAQPEFIFPEGANKQRGRFELAFSQIGTSVMIGGGIGGLAGVYNGFKATNALNQTGKLRRTQLLNHIMKQGSGTANSLGTLAVLYSACGVLLQYARGEDDHVNTIIAGSATGLLYKSTAGLRRCALGGAVGLGISSLYCLYLLAQERGNSSSPKFL